MMNISSINTSGAYTSETSSSIGPRNDSAAQINIKPPQNAKAELGLTDETIRKNLDRILQAIKLPETTIDRSIHDVTKQVIYKVKDIETGEVIRQFPEEKLVEAAAVLIELTGIMVDRKV